MSVPTTVERTATKTANPLEELAKYGQSCWLDYIRRSLLTSGELKRLIEQDGVGGVTSNPAIFEKAITGSTDYAEALLELQKRKELDAMGIYEIMAIEDIQGAADTMRPVYDRTKKRDGYVSFEVSPFLAKDTEGTIKDARRLWKAVNRPNLMVKVPATLEGIPAIQTLISEGMNINVTLLFAQDMYEKVAQAYIAGLKTYVRFGRRSQPCGQRGQLFHQPHRQHGGRNRQGQAQDRARREEAGSAAQPGGQHRDRQRQAYLPALQGNFLRARVGDLGQERRSDAAAVVGQHQHQGSQLSGRSVRG